MTQGQGRDVRIFSHTGCVLLAMFANTPRAKDFRAWAKRVLAGEAQLECRCEELAALISLVRRQVAAARASALFEARAK